MLVIITQSVQTGSTLALQLIVLKGNRKLYRYKKLSSMSSKPVTMSTIFY